MGSNKQTGVTLVELCMVLAIIAIVLGTALPSFAGHLEKQRIEGVATRLVSGLRFARSEAVRLNERVRLTLQNMPWGTCAVVHTGTAHACQCNETDTACIDGAQVLHSLRVPSGERVTLAGNVTSIVFDPLHGTSTPAGTLRVVGASGRAIHEVVNITGRVRMCSPRGAKSSVAGYPTC